MPFLGTPLSEIRRSPMERQIIMSGPMVRAILDGRKTQTRRPVKKPIVLDWLGQFLPEFIAAPENHLSPYGYPGDRLWVRETHAGDNLCGWVYRADHPDADISAGELDDGEQSLRRWVPSIHMPREACRLVLEVAGVRVERLQGISEADAMAEGAPAVPEEQKVAPAQALEWYRRLWDSLNAKRAPWASNPWVWVVDFRRMK